MQNTPHKKTYSIISPVILIALAVIVALMAPSCRGGKQPGVTLDVFCGSAVKPAIDEAAAVFANQTGIRINPIYGGSGEVLSQMELSRRGDVYIAGSPDFMIKAARKKLVRPETERALAYLVPAIIVQIGNPRNITTLKDLSRPGVTVGIGNPESVCVGTYAVEILEKNKLTTAVGSNIKAVTASCAAVASLVAMKTTDAVIGWMDFAAWSPDTSEIVKLKPGEVPRIAYVAAAVAANTKHPSEAARFISFLSSAQGRALFNKHGSITDREQALKLAPGAKIGGEYKPDTKALFGEHK